MTKYPEPPSKIRCLFCEIRQDGLFRRVGDDKMERVECEKVLHRYRAHQIIFHEGTPPLAVYCIRTGMVKLFRSGKRGEDVVLRVLGPGEAFGYRPVLCDEPYAASAEAVEATEVCVVPKQTLLDLLRDEPAFALDLLARVAYELRVSEDQILDLTQRTVLQRTAGLLVTFVEACGERTNGGIRLAIPVQRKEMAQMVGTTPETFSRTLRDLADKGILSLSRLEMVVTDETALRRQAGA